MNQEITDKNELSNNSDSYDKSRMWKNIDLTMIMA